MTARTGSPKRILLLGATGTIGRAAARAFAANGDRVVALVRPRPGGTPPDVAPGLEICTGEANDRAALARVFADPVDAVVSCMASRTGAPADAWAVDHAAHRAVLAAAQSARVSRFVLLSAICVQKPRLAFQHAKRAFERELQTSGLAYAIVRPTAYFKSLSGQIARVQAGKPYLLFGDGTLTACKPISDADLARYLVRCVTDESLRDRILPIGGPGPAITPREQGEKLFELTGRKPRFRSVPVALFDAIAGGLGLLGRVSPAADAKAEFARIARYYATESMLVWDGARGRYDAAATPETGSDKLFEYYARVIAGDAAADRGDHAMF